MSTDPATLSELVLATAFIVGALVLGWFAGRSQARPYSPPTSTARITAVGRVTLPPLHDSLSGCGVFSPDVDGVMKKVEDDG